VTRKEQGFEQAGGQRCHVLFSRFCQDLAPMPVLATLFGTLFVVANSKVLALIEAPEPSLNHLLIGAPGPNPQHSELKCRAA
jgi:hypothetical protein